MAAAEWARVFDAVLIKLAQAFLPEIVIAARSLISGVSCPVYVAALVWIIDEAAAAELDFTVGPPVWNGCGGGGLDRQRNKVDRRGRGGWGLDRQRNKVDRRWRWVRRPLRGGGVSLRPGIGAGGVSTFATPLLR